MTILFAPEAEADFATVIGYVAERNPAAAAELGRRIFIVIDQLAAGEFDGPEQSLAGGAKVRSWPVPPVRVYYQRAGESFFVVRIYHQARSPLPR